MSSSMSQVLDCLEASNMQGAMEQMIHLLGKPDDMQKLKEDGQLLQRLHEIEEVQGLNLKKIIQGFLTLKENEEAIVISNSTNLNQAADQELTEAKQIYEQKSKQKDAMQKECIALQGQLDQLDDEQRRLQGQKDVVKEQTTEILPKTRYNIGLYGCATKLNWDYSAKSDEVKGYVCSNKDVRPFSLDSNQHSKFFITNYLWDLIEAVAAGEK